MNGKTQIPTSHPPSSYMTRYDSTMKSPLTPGEILLEEYWRPMPISQKAMARALFIACPNIID